MLSQGMEKKEIIKVLDNLDKFIVKGTVKKGRGRNKESQLMHFELTKRGRRKWIEESAAEELRTKWMK